MKCLNCSKETTNPKFCSRSCAASFNNKLHPKRTFQNTCKVCNECCSKARTYCRNCWKLLVHTRFLESMSNKSLEEIQNKRKYQISSVIRSCARVIYKKSDRPKYCSVCGYSKHYEVCHMKAINSFSPSIMISEINNLDNLVALCPNCHWELDNGLLEI